MQYSILKIICQTLNFQPIFLSLKVSHITFKSIALLKLPVKSLNSQPKFSLPYLRTHAIMYYIRNSYIFNY
nr:MAG TPA: hypothetical protein [Caudoviricetes sp.]